jgi:predicted HTH domain antitoxin
MKTVAVNVPDALLLHTSDEELARQSQFLLALKFFELGRVTSGQAAEMCGMNRVDFLVAASQTGTPVADLNEQELRREIRDATS